MLIKIKITTLHHNNLIKILIIKIKNFNLNKITISSKIMSIEEIIIKIKVQKKIKIIKIFHRNVFKIVTITLAKKIAFLAKYNVIFKILLFYVKFLYKKFLKYIKIIIIIRKIRLNLS